MTSEPKFHDMTQLYVQSVRAHASRPLFGTKSGGAWRWITYGDFGADVGENLVEDGFQGRVFG